MNNTQRTIIAIYLPLTILIIIFHIFYQQQDVVLYLKYMTMFTMLLTAVFVKKKFREQKIIAVAFFFVIISDFFFVFSLTLDNFAINRDLFGMLGFLLAYVCLILAFSRNFKIGKIEIIIAVPIVAAFLFVFLSLKQYIKGPMFIAAIVFGIILFFMTWSAVSSMFRGYFSRKAARIIALVGLLLLISDLGGVAYNMFDPNFSDFVLWNKNLIWGTYVPSWALMLFIICEENLTASVAQKQDQRCMNSVTSSAGRSERN